MYKRRQKDMKRNITLFAIALIAVVASAGNAAAFGEPIFGYVSTTAAEGDVVVLWVEDDRIDNPNNNKTIPIGHLASPNSYYFEDIEPLLKGHGKNIGDPFTVTVASLCSGLDMDGDPYTNTYHNDAGVTTTDTYGIAGPTFMPDMDIEPCPTVDEPDLIVESVVLNPDCKHYYFANEPNEIDVTIKNIGTADAGQSHTKVTGASGASATVAVSALAPGASETVRVSDAVARPVGETVKAVADCDGEVTESDETNNDSPDETVIYNGYKGKRFTDGDDIETKRSYDLNGNLVYSIGDSVYMSGYSYWTEYIVDWTTCTDILPVPDTATVLEATLYTMYTWDSDGAMPDGVSMSFNSVDQEPEQVHYMDEKYYPSSYPYGMLVYDVTSEFDRDSNTATLTKADATKRVSMRGMLLVVVYSDATEPRRQIFINEGFDLLYGGATQCTTPAEATAYAPINGVDMADVVDADLIVVAPGAGSHDGAYSPIEGDLGFNARNWLDAWDFLDGTGVSQSEESELGVRDVKVTSDLAVDNEVRFTSSGDWMEASNAILVVTHGERGEQCLGTCCADPDCLDPLAIDITCKECIDVMGGYWHPNLDENCFPVGAVREDLCLDWCPECCDGIDNADEDVDIDFPADQQCSCGLDPSEWNPACPIPELATFTLVGIGLMMFAGVVYRRKE